MQRKRKYSQVTEAHTERLNQEILNGPLDTHVGDDDGDDNGDDDDDNKDNDKSDEDDRINKMC